MSSSSLRHTGQRLLSLGRQRSVMGQQQQQCAASAVSLQQARHDTPEELRAAMPFSQVPHPLSLPLIGSLYRLPWQLLRGRDVVAMQTADFAKYGQIYKDTLGQVTLVYTTDVTAVEKIHRLEGRYPQRLLVSAWVAWREQHGLSKGVLIESDGEQWRRMRTQLDRQMLRPRQVATYADDFNQVTSDFIDRLRRQRRPDTAGVDNLDKELFGWSLETIGTMLYETRFGNFADEKDPEMAKFISAVQDMFRSTEKVIYFPPKVTRLLFRKWYDMHWGAWDTIFTKGMQLIDQKLEEIDRQLSRDESVEPGFLSALLASGKMSRPEIYANVSELMLAAVDTTSNTMQWVIEMLSRHPEIQERLHEEVTGLLPRGQLPTADDIQKLPLLRAVVKEVLRMYPVAGVITKVLKQDTILCGYVVPKDSSIICNTFLMGRDPALYPDPLTFRPERWLREADNKRHANTHAFAWLPFAHGPRMCVGRRIAELEMHILLARLSQEFRIVQIEAEPRKVQSRGLLVPEKAVNVQYVDR